jgi:hypothetical protein
MKRSIKFAVAGLCLQGCILASDLNIGGLFVPHIGESMRDVDSEAKAAGVDLSPPLAMSQCSFVSHVEGKAHTSLGSVCFDARGRVTKLSREWVYSDDARAMEFSRKLFLAIAELGDGPGTFSVAAINNPKVQCKFLSLVVGKKSVEVHRCINSDEGTDYPSLAVEESLK